MKVNVVDRGADPKGAADSTTAFLSALSSLASTARATPWGVYYGGGVLEVPDGRYVLSSDIVLAGVSGAHRYGQITLRGEGRLASLLDFKGGHGLVLSDAPGINVDCHARAEDVGVLSDATAVRITGGGQCSIERCLLSGATGVLDDASDMTTIRETSFYGTGTGVRAQSDCNGIAVERCQFNGPTVAVHHAGGVGHRVLGCNAEGAVMGRFTSCADVLHEGWLHEGNTRGWHFDDGGSAGFVLVATSVTIRGGFTSATSPVRIDPKAVVYHLRLEHVNAPSAPAVVDNPYWGSVTGDVYVSGPRAGLWFANQPAAVHDLSEVGLAGYVPGNATGNGPVLPPGRDGQVATAWHVAGSPTPTAPVYFCAGKWRRLDGSEAAGT